MVTEIWVNTGSGNGLLPDGTKPLPESVLTSRQWGSLQADILCNECENGTFEIIAKSLRRYRCDKHV